MLAKKNCSEADRVARRAWELLRAALLWARKGGVFKHRLMMMELPKFLKNQLSTNASSTKSRPQRQIHYFEREFSFDKTPLFNLKMHRPSSMCFIIPCLNPPPILHDIDDDDRLFHSEHHYDEGRMSFLTNTDLDCAADDDDDEDDDALHQGIITLSEDSSPSSCANYEDEAVDRKADEFIAKFYQQMKLQRQSSYLRYHDDMLNQGTN